MLAAKNDLRGPHHNLAAHSTLGYEAGDTNVYRYVGNNPTNATDPSGLQEEKNNDDIFRDAGKKNCCPEEIIELILKVAKETTVQKPGFLDKVHNYCERWVDTFESNLRAALNEKGHKDGLKVASKGCISGPPEKTVWLVPGTITNSDHTTSKITFQDGTVFYVDCATLSGGTSHIGLSTQIPNWRQYPIAQPPPLPPGKEIGRDGMSIDGTILYRPRP